MFEFEISTIYALIAGIGIAMIAGVMGCFVVWRRMAYFGDSLAHSSLLGLVLGLAIGISINLAIIIICSIFALLLLWLQHKKLLATDTLLGILAHCALSIGMVVISILNYNLDLHDYLFGDILTITKSELYWIYGGGLVILTLIWHNWQSLILMTINQDLARVEGVKIFFNNLLLMFLMTIIVAVSIRAVGILLITSMLIIPAATARQLSKSPEIMAVIAAIMGIIAVCAGIFASQTFATPSGPSIVVAAVALFVISLIFANNSGYSSRAT